MSGLTFGISLKWSVEELQLWHFRIWWTFFSCLDCDLYDSNHGNGLRESYTASYIACIYCFIWYNSGAIKEDVHVCYLEGISVYIGFIKSEF